MKKNGSIKCIAAMLLVVLLLFVSQTQAIAAPRPTFYDGLAIKADYTLWQWHSLIDDNEFPPQKIADNIISLTEAGGRALVIKDDGSLWAWGNNSSGQIGDGTTEYREAPVRIIDNVISAASGEKHSLAVKSDGSLWAWGDKSGLAPQKIMDDALAVYAGMVSSFAVKNDGSLWTWGYNAYGQFSDNIIVDPIKIMDNVLSVASGYGFGGMHTLVVKNDGSLWVWGVNTAGQIGDGTTINKEQPVKIMDNVVTAAAGEGKSLAITKDGSLWAWGRWVGSVPQKIMDNVVAVNIDMAGAILLVLTADGKLWEWDFFNEKAVMIMEDVLLPSANISEQTVSSPTEAYIYDTVDIGTNISLPTYLLIDVYDQTSALLAIQSAISGLTTEQKANATAIDLLTLFAEEAVAQAASLIVNSADITITLNIISALQESAQELKKAAEEALIAGGISIIREMQVGIKFITATTDILSIAIDPSTINTTADQIRVTTPTYEISFSRKALQANAADSMLIIVFSENADISAVIGPYDGFAENSSYSISFNKPLTENIKVSLPPLDNDPRYQAIVNSADNAVGGKYNPITAKLEMKIKENDIYTVRENFKDFSDIHAKSQEMQNAICVLTSKGIINGTASSVFSPDDVINRAEIAALIVRTLFKLDANADGGFGDVKKADWFFGAVGSAKRFGIINGISATAFAPLSNIQKDQIVAICARTLRMEMKYKEPADLESHLTVYSDRNELPVWGEADIALATQVNLVVRRTDGRFNPGATMTRGNAAIILYRMFIKIW